MESKNYLSIVFFSHHVHIKIDGVDQCNIKQKSVQDDNSFFMTSFKPFKKENELRLVLMLFLVFERNSEVPWFESKCDIGNNSDQKFRERENHP